MRFTFRTKLIVVIGATAVAFLVLIVVGAVTAGRVRGQLDAIRETFVPKMVLGPQLEAGLEAMRRGLQDSVAARDGDALEETRVLRDTFLQRLSDAETAINPGDAAALRAATTAYFAEAYGLARRMIEGETGEAIIESMTAMQARQMEVKELLKKSIALDQSAVAAAFVSAADSQTTSGRVRLWVTTGCLVFVIALSFLLSRSVLSAMNELSAGFARFGGGDFGRPVEVPSGDELGRLAEQANHMADRLRRLGVDRDRADWLKTGHVGLSRELRGELEPEEAAERAVRFLARYLEAPAGALYYANRQGILQLIGRYALPTDAGDIAPGFRPGEGLVGQAALHEAITVITDPPEGYFRIRSGLGEAIPRAIVLLPLVHLGKVKGVLEFAFFKAWSEPDGELLLAVRETLAIAMEVSSARAAMRDLLAETQRQAERLSTQEEQLQANNEELTTQQHELRQTNDELMQKTAELEVQRAALQKKNAELDEARAALEDRATELTKASAYKSQFLANMSHELRTPLNSMLLLSSLLSENEARNLTEKQVEYARTVYSAGKDLLALINQVLDLAKVEAGKQDVRIGMVSLDAVLEHAEGVFQPLASHKGLAFRVEVEPGIPDVLSTDGQRLQQIVNNLLANAIKFTAKGEVVLRVHRPGAAHTFRRDDLEAGRVIAFSVSDTGLGVAPEHRERIFAPFEQVEGASDRRFGGTGLGLAISRELAHLLGGELSLESALGQGSTFTCYLPLELSADDAAARPRLSMDPARAAAMGSLTPRRKEPARPPQADSADGARLLVIEDDAAFAQAFADVIEGQGLDCVVATDGESGLEMAKRQRPTGIILDVKLPGVDGFQIMDKLRADPATADIPVHFVSAMDAAERGMAMGAVGYLTKPASRYDLARVVESLVPGARSCRILVVEDDRFAGESLVKQLTAENLDARRVGSAMDALDAVKRDRYACIVLDLSLPDMDGLELLRSLEDECGAAMPSIVVYTARDLNKLEAKRLEAYAEAVVLKDGSSTERLVDEIRLFVRRLKDGLGPRRAGAAAGRGRDVRLEGKKVLVADDDMRTVYALSATLRAKGAEVFVADTGRAAVGAVDEHADLDVVLMDIMMPEMDGYEAIRRIRQNERFRNLPIIALTAKAMKGDRDKCLEVGATSYMPKPIDPDRLVAMIHALFPGDAAHGS